MDRRTCVRRPYPASGTGIVLLLLNQWLHSVHTDKSSQRYPTTRLSRRQSLASATNLDAIGASAHPRHFRRADISAQHVRRSSNVSDPSPRSAPFAVAENASMPLPDASRPGKLSAEQYYRRRLHSTVSIRRSAKLGRSQNESDHVRRLLDSSALAAQCSTSASHVRTGLARRRQFVSSCRRIAKETRDRDNGLPTSPLPRIALATAQLALHHLEKYMYMQV